MCCNERDSNLICAHYFRIAALYPLNPAAHTAKGLVDSSRGSHCTAVKHLQAALKLLQFESPEAVEAGENTLQNKSNVL